MFPTVSCHSCSRHPPAYLHNSLLLFAFPTPSCLAVSYRSCFQTPSCLRYSSNHSCSQQSPDFATASNHSCSQQSPAFTSVFYCSCHGSRQSLAFATVSCRSCSRHPPALQSATIRVSRPSCLRNSLPAATISLEKKLIPRLRDDKLPTSSTSPPLLFGFTTPSTTSNHPQAVPLPFVFATL